MKRPPLALLASISIGSSLTILATLAPATLATAPPAPALTRALEVETAGSLRPDGRAQALELTPGDLRAGAWRVSVPRDATGLRLWTTGATGDVALFVDYGRAPDPAADSWLIAGENIWVDEELFLEVSDLQPLVAGDWFVQAVAADAPGADPGKVTVELHAELVRPPRTQLVLGTPLELTLEREHGLRAVLDIDLPSDLGEDEVLVLEARGSLADVNLVAGPADPLRTLDDAFARGDSALAYERIEVPVSALADGLALHVYAFQEFERLEQISVRVLANRGAKAGHGLCPTAALGETRPSDASPESPLAAALDATVVVFGPRGSGSGVVLSADGLIVTNAHVVSGVAPSLTGGEPGAGSRPRVAVGFTTDPARAPEPVFGAVLIDYREDLDLALLQLSSDLAGRPLEPGLYFPHLKPGVLAAPALGGVVFSFGYPMTGGSGTMVTLTVTRGVFSGFAPEAEGVLYKIDAGIHSGVSGGPCVDGTGRLLGVASSSISDSNLAGGLGFVIPLELFPQSWLERAR